MSAVQTIAARAGGLQPVVAARPASWRLALGSPQCVFGAILVALFVFLGVFGPVLAPYHYDDQDLASQYRPPIWAGGQADHPLGTDQFGRDVLSRLLYGARVSLLVGLFSVVLAGAIGVTIGVVSGYLGGTIERLFMRIADVQYAFPYILLAIIITAFWGPSLVSLIVALGLAGWMTFARTARASTLSVKEREYIVAARALGASHGRIMLAHILPNIAAPLLVFATFQLPSRMLAEASLSFVGLGIQPPMPSWGNMLAQSRNYMVTYPWLVILPGLALTIVALGVNQLGDGLRDILDPHTRGRRHQSL
jgi:peptide/nickel transport system permease protein